MAEANFPYLKLAKTTQKQKNFKTEFQTKPYQRTVY
jgi:hypothetical protein